MTAQDAELRPQGTSTTAGVRAIQELGLPERDTVLAIGVFDGVHRGHQALIERVVARAQRDGTLPMVVTFHPHPRAVLRPGTPVTWLSTRLERERLLIDLGIEIVVTIDFSQSVASIVAEEFTGLLRQVLRMRALVVGPDFALGHKRQGTVPVLQELGERQGFEVEVVSPVVVGEQLTRSSAIRSQLAEGNLPVANELLGRPYVVGGPIIHGDRRGRTIGFPTANVSIPSARLLPANGVYVVRAELERNGKVERVYGVANVGRRPTFDGQGILLEVHLLDFKDDIYGCHLQVSFLERLREERKFESIEELKEQITRDALKAAEYHRRAAGG